MNPERILALDISSKTGYAVLTSLGDTYKLEDYGQIQKIECPEGKYPVSYILWAYEIYEKIEELFETYTPTVLVIEETCHGSKNAYSQKILEWTHFLVAKLIKDTGIKNVYLRTGDWRKEIGSHMNAEEKKQNKYIKEYKKKNKTKLARDIKTGKVIGKISKKHVTIRLINDVFSDQLKTKLRRKDEDASDAISLAYCYHLQRKRGLH